MSNPKKAFSLNRGKETQSHVSVGKDACCRFCKVGDNSPKGNLPRLDPGGEGLNQEVSFGWKKSLGEASAGAAAE